MRRLVLSLVACFATASLASGDIYGPGAGGAIPDSPGGPFSSTIVINNSLQPTITSVNSVRIDVSTAHTWIGDLTVTLVAPNGDDVQLMRRTGTGGSGSSGDWLVGTFFFVDDGSGLTIPSSGNVAPGTYNRTNNAASTTTTPAVDPDNYSIFNLDNINGTWTLNILDSAGGDTGAIGAWYLDITSVPEPTTMVVIGMIGLAGFVGYRFRRR